MFVAAQDPIETFQLIAHATPEVLPPLLNEVFHTSISADAELRVGLAEPVMERVACELGTEAAKIANMIIRVQEKNTGWREYYLSTTKKFDPIQQLEVIAQLIAIQEIRDGHLPATVHDLPQTATLIL